MPLRVVASTVGATIRTVPFSGGPLPEVSCAFMPGLSDAMSLAATSARHSSRPWRIMRNSSWPAGNTAPTVARGEFEVGRGSGLTLPQSAVLLRDGFSYVLRVGADSKVSQVKVGVGRRVGDRIEITSGLAADGRVVAAGGGFLSDGDTVRVVDAAALKPAAPVAASAPK